MTSRKQLFKRLYSGYDWIKDIGVRIYFLFISIILDSFQNKIQQKVVFYLSYFFKQSGERSPLK
jgi:hypothetical protein